MFQHHSARRALFAAVVAVSSLVSIAAHADGDQPRPGSFAAIMAIKDPANFGPHLPAADLPSTYRAPVPGSIAAISAVKDPAHFGPHLLAADVPSRYVPPAPGSIAAILAVKDPANFGPHLPAADGSAPAGTLAAGDTGHPGLRDCDRAC